MSRISISHEDCYVNLSYNPKNKIIRITGSANHEIFYTGEVFYSIPQLLNELGITKEDLIETIFNDKDPWTQGKICNHDRSCVLDLNHIGPCLAHEKVYGEK